jgi:hypothetical protein
VRQSGALELGDALLDDGVPAMVGFDLGHVAVAVGNRRVLVPGGEQQELTAGDGWCGTPRTTRRTWLACRRSLANTVNAVSAMSAPETSGVLNQYGIGCQAASSIASIAARIRLSCRAVMEKRTSDFAAVASTALE